MSLRPIDEWYLNKEDPVGACLQSLRIIILSCGDDITESWSYQMPFFYYRGIRFCYLWVHKKSGWPYLGIVDGNKIDHPDLIAEKRTRMKIMLIDPAKKIPAGKIRTLLREVLSHFE